MKDITAILINYSKPFLLNKALNSLKVIQPRMEKIIVIHEQNIPLNIENSWLNQVQFMFTQYSNLVKIVNDTIRKVKSTYILFLQDTDYISKSLEIDTLHLPKNKDVIETIQNNIVQPVFIRTTFLKKHPFLPIPFKAALLPAWSSNIDRSNKDFRKDLLVQARKIHSKNHTIIQEFIQKYQLDKIKTNHPSLTVFISNYNMEKYVETAITSCLLQNEKPDQILIIDDGSTDSSYNKIQRWSIDKRISIFQQENQGKAKALNHLLPFVSSEFVLELDADDWLDPNAISIIKKQLSSLTKDVSLLYGNFRNWKQLENNELLFKRLKQGNEVYKEEDLLQYRFPLGPRIYRTSTLKQIGGFPVIEFENGRLYEDVSVLKQLINRSRLLYRDFTVYNVREHKESITKNNLSKWKQFKKTLK